MARLVRKTYVAEAFGEYFTGSKENVEVLHTPRAQPTANSYAGTGLTTLPHITIG